MRPESAAIGAAETRQRSLALLGLLAAAAAGAILLVVAFPVKSPFADPDSLEYLDAARSLRAGRGLALPPWGWHDFRDGWEPMRDFPPGFPVAVWLLSLLGIAPERAILAIPAASYVLLPFALHFALRRAVTAGTALAAAVVPTFLVVTIVHATMAMSDVPHLFLAAIGFGLVFRSIEKGSLRGAFAGGVVAGLALAMRNAGIAAPAAVVLGLLGAAAGGGLPKRAATRVLLGYTAGAGVAYASVIVRNVVTFGAIQPWERFPSAVSAAEVPRELFNGLEWVFLGGLLSWRRFALLLAVGIAIALGLWLLDRRRRPDGAPPASPVRAAAGIILGLYALFGVALVAFTRLRYHVDPIGDRFLLQYHWILVAGFLTLVRLAFRRSGIPGARGRVVVLSIALLFVLVGQGRRLGGLREEMRWLEARFEAHEPFRALVAGLPPETVVTSIVAPQLQERFGRPILQLRNVTPERLAAEICPERDLVVLLHPSEKPGLESWEAALAGDPPAGYRELMRRGEVVALAHDRVGAVGGSGP